MLLNQESIYFLKMGNIYMLVEPILFEKGFKIIAGRVLATTPLHLPFGWLGK